MIYRRHGYDLAHTIQSPKIKQARPLCRAFSFGPGPDPPGPDPPGPDPPGPDPPGPDPPGPDPPGPYDQF